MMYNVEMKNLDFRGVLTMKRCGYCGKKINGNQEFCCNECENNYREIVENDSHKIKYYLLGIVVGFLVMLGGVLSSSDFVIGTGILLMGFVVVLLPFTTPETTALFGYQKSKIIGRFLGVLLVIVGMGVGYC